MNIVCIGGGPAGLYFALLMKQLSPSHDITVVERNRPYDTFGWGVVFSDATMDNMRAWDAPTADAIQQAFNHWDDIELHFKGRVIRSGGHGFVGIGRKKLLNILQARCEDLGVKLVFETEVEAETDFPDADLIHRQRRRQLAGSAPVMPRSSSPTSDAAQPLHLARHEQAVRARSPSCSRRPSTAGSRPTSTSSTTRRRTFIVECPEHVWKAHGLDDARPGPVDRLLRAPVRQ